MWVWVLKVEREMWTARQRLRDGRVFGVREIYGDKIFMKLIDYVVCTEYMEGKVNGQS